MPATHSQIEQAAVDAAQRITIPVEEAASLIDVHPRTIRREIAKGTIPSIRLGRRVLIPRKPFFELFGESAPNDNA
ncbi:excisionase family DNA-binding protein [Prescottella equi]|uniref:excisionase family DNA-binding protein n=1 Tax=Rhodococcus hoagii TaxID=43767 RepID=UPI001C2EACDE|nr:excisionase family DNA-binding protein [Prescottella equi]